MTVDNTKKQTLRLIVTIIVFGTFVLFLADPALAACPPDCPASPDTPRVTPLESHSVQFQSLAGIPGVNPNTVDIGVFINALYALAITIAGMFAVVRIILAGVQYMFSDLVTTKEQAKVSIRGAILGLLIVLGAALILGTINPNLGNLQIFELGRQNRITLDGIRPPAPVLPPIATPTSVADRDTAVREVRDNACSDVRRRNVGLATTVCCADPGYTGASRCPAGFGETAVRIGTEVDDTFVDTDRVYTEAEVAELKNQLGDRVVADLFETDSVDDIEEAQEACAETDPPSEVLTITHTVVRFNINVTEERYLCVTSAAEQGIRVGGIAIDLTKTYSESELAALKAALEADRSLLTLDLEDFPDDGPFITKEDAQRFCTREGREQVIAVDALIGEGGAATIESRFFCTRKPL